MKTILEYGQRLAIRILVANDLGIAVGFVGIAEKYLKTGIFEDCFFGYFLQEEAIILAQKYYKEKEQ